MQISSVRSSTTKLSPEHSPAVSLSETSQAITSTGVSNLHTAADTDWKSADIKNFSSHKVAVESAPSGIQEIEIQKFQLGKDGPSFQVASLGATPLQITTKDGKNILWNSLTEANGQLKTKIQWDLRGAGFLGGSPIVAPASRIADEGGNPIINYNNTRIDLSDFVGANKRIPKDKATDDGLAMHGAIFTSPHWELTNLETKGVNAEDGVRVTYALNFADDEALKPFGQDGQAEVVYQLTKDEKGDPVFYTDLKFTNPADASEDLLLGAVAQHCFFDYGPDKDKARLITNLAERYEGWHKGHQSLPTGNIVKNEELSPYNFTPKAGRLLYGMKDDHDGTSSLDAVLTNTDPQANAEATLKRSDELKVQVKNGEGFNGIVVCTKNPNAAMIEPIAARPNNFNTPGKYGKLDEAIVLKPGQSKRFTSTISLAA